MTGSRGPRRSGRQDVDAPISSAQIPHHYENAILSAARSPPWAIPPRQIGKFKLEVLILSCPDAEGEVVLFKPDIPLPNGARLF
ncbi:putative chaperone CsaA [Methylovirgula sp. HY1]|nr:putative chaperone CsaA [Methylovirgula sp. HY1]